MGTNPRVVVIDDSKSNLDVFCEFLTLNNVDVVGQGKNGIEAVRLFEQYNPDVVLADLAMPVYDGYFALNNILAADKNAKVVIITALEGKKDTPKLLKLGAIDVLQKPIDLNRVVDVINNIFKEKKFLQV
jgi:DNA-binding NarL/FixJ family response regulator